LVIGFAFVLFSPTWMYQHGLPDSITLHKQFDSTRMSVDLAGLQSGAVGILLISVAFQISACNGDTFLWFGSGTLLFFWGVYALWHITTSAIGWRLRLWSFLVAVPMGFCGVLIFAVLRSIQLALVPTGYIAVFVLIGLSALVIAINAFVAPKFGGWAAAVLAVVLSMWLLVVLPMNGANPVIFPEMVAQLLGVRDAKSQELRVPKKTCELILSALGSIRPSKGINCSTDEWGAVNAQVLSNVGDRWVIQINTNSVVAGVKEPYLRLTIPNQDVQMIKFNDDASRIKRRTSCDQ